MKKWKVVSKEDVSPSRWFPIYKHIVQLPDGSIIDDYYMSPMGEIAMVLPILKDGKIVLAKQYKHGVGEIVIELPAGFRKQNLSLEQTAIEELDEEVGIKTDINNLISLGKFAVNPTKMNSVVFGYLAQNLEFNSRQNLEQTEDIEIITKSAKEVLNMIKNQEIWVSDSVAFILKANQNYPELFN